jgi:hypothetical protein
VRIVPWEEVADDWMAHFGDKGIHFDIIPPKLLPILAERGANIIAPHKGMGKACNDAYAEWNEQNGRTMFSSVPGSLVAMHNLTASDLGHVVKMGGIANPSMAVVNSDISVLDNFGEITLIAPRELIEKKTGKNAGTWAADAYSPRYPNVEYVIPYKKQRELEQRAVDAGVNKYEATAFVQRIEDSGKKWLIGDRTARALFANEGREGESFEDYIDRLMNEVVQKEQIFMGYTDNGRRYAKHTLANVSRIMKKEGRAGAEGHFGVGSIRAQLTPIFKTIAQIQKNKDRIVSAEEWKEAEESVNKRYYALADEIGYNELGEALLERDPKDYLEREYDIEITNEEEAQIKQLAADLTVMPTEYFETKFERPVMLNEFVGAIIPENTSERTRKILDDAGIPYKTYNQEVEGDRKQVVQDYTKELDEEVGGVRFSVADSAPMLNDVAQRGLRDMYGKDYDTFVLDVYANLPEVEREKIANAASKIGWDFPRATEQYLARLADDKTFAEMDADNWSRVRDMFNDMTGTTLNNSDLRYALWRNTENATEKRDDNPLALASDIAMRDRLNRSTEEPGMAMFSVAPSPSVSREKAQVRAVYEHRVRSGAFQAREALQDSMLALKDAMEMITGEKFIDVEDFENAYFGENRLSSTNKAEMDLFDKMVIRPMIEEATRIAPTDEAFEQLVDYMMAKHGLERNALMRERAVQAIKDRVQAQEEAGEEVDYEAADRDYAGLTTLTGKKNVKDAELEAESMVRVFEENHEVKALWDKVNATNKAILSKQLECGLIDQETYDKIAGMYNYYIPLRGFDEKTAEEVYAYMGQQGSGFAQPIKKAKGRGSKADNPFVYMQMMADSAIMQGNRNVLVKQRFLNFVLNHPNDLVSVNSLWLRKGIDGWVAVFPDNIEDDDTPQQVEAKMKAWEAEMEVKAENYPKLYKKGGQKENIPFRVVHKSDLQQHQIIVMRAGKPVVLTVNGNPRLALAINGLTNPDNKVNGPISAVFATGEYINRKLSAAYTSLNPNFVLSNFMRDMAYTSASVWAKEPAKYAAMFDVFVARFNPIYMGKLYHMHKHGELDMSDPVHKRFAEFIEHGGETGYVALRDVEKHRKDLKKVIKESRGVSAKQGWDYLWAKLDDVNKAVENTARFAAYYTSREQGRSIGRSIYDAKDVSVNFNKKGAGARFMGATGQTYTGNAAAFTAGLGKALYAFWNPAIQGLTNYGRQFKKKPWIASTQAASLFALGALMAVLSDDDDEEGKHQSYYDLPESVRRSNITINIGDGNFITWALPIEFRSIYGLGEIVGSVLSGKAHMTDEEIQKAVLQQVSGMLPLDIAAEGGNAFVPTWAKPIWEVYNNEAYGGVPIYKETGYNGHRPGWAKAYKNTSPWLVEGAKYLNDTIGGGDAHTSAGKYDWNPAVVEHILKGYLGGLYQAPKQLIDMGQVFAGEREYNPSDMLMLNRVLKKGDDRTKNRELDRRYFNAVDRMKVLRARRAGYLRDTETGYENFSDKIAEMVENKDWVRVEIFNEFQRPINELSAIINSSRDEVLIENLENARNDLKRSFLKTLEGVDELGNEESGK